MVWLTLLKIRTNLKEGLEPVSFIRHQEVSALKFFQPACLCPGLLGAVKERGLGEPLGKASLANTAHRLGKLISMTNKSS